MATGSSVLVLCNEMISCVRDDWLVLIVVSKKTMPNFQQNHPLHQQFQNHQTLNPEIYPQTHDYTGSLVASYGFVSD